MRPFTPEGALGMDEGSNSSTSFGKRPRPSASNDFEEEETAEEDYDYHIVYRNQPVQMSVYRDPATQNEKVVIIALLFGGVADAQFSLVGEGPGTRMARIEFLWPEVAVLHNEIFAQEIKEGEFPSCHPMLEALRKDLERNRKCVDERPNCSVDLTLPISVQTASSSIKIFGKVRKDGTRFLIVQLMAYQSAYTVKEKDKIVVFKDM